MEHSLPLFEIQLHLLIFHSLTVQGGHMLYEWTRSFSVSEIISASDVLASLNKVLLREMLEVSGNNLQAAIKD